jgi:hypothetical protein
MCVRPLQCLRLTPEIAALGRNNRVVAVKAHLNADGLKRPEAHDTSFRALVTLANSEAPLHRATPIPEYITVDSFLESTR